MGCVLVVFEIRCSNAIMSSVICWQDCYIMVAFLGTCGIMEDDDHFI